MLNLENKLIRYALQAINYSVFMGMIWYLSTSPSYQQIAEDEAVINISFSHAGETKEPCHRRTQAELMKLPPNMRAPMDCSRERSPIIIEALLDGDLIYSQTLNAPGIYKDGSVDIYHSVKIPAGSHRFSIKMDDSVLKEGFDYKLDQNIEINPAKILLVDFNAGQGFFIK